MHGSGVKADLLASLCNEVGATEYISVPGSKDYLDQSTAFEKLGLPVRYFDYQHPEYPQLFGDFIPYMSVIDMLFNCGEQSSYLIRSGIDFSPNETTCHHSRSWRFQTNPSKNIRDFCGQPMITTCLIRLARAVSSLSYTCPPKVSVRQVVSMFGFPPDFSRPEYLADDHTPIMPVLHLWLKSMRVVDVILMRFGFFGLFAVD